MRRITWFFLGLASVLWVVYIQQNYSEPMSVVFPQWGMIEARPHKLLMAILAGFFIISAVLALWFWLWDRFNASERHKIRRRQRRANKDLIEGIMHFAAGDYPAAKGQLLKNADYSPISGLNHLIVARTEHELGHFHERDEHIQTAAELMPDEHIVVSLAQADMQIASGQLTQANQAIDQALELEPKNSQLLKLKFKALHDLNHWQEIYQWIVEDRISLPAEQRQAYLLESLQYTLPNASQSRIETMAQQLGIRHSQNQAIVIGFITAIIESHPAFAQQLCDGYLSDYWSASLAELYSRMPNADVSSAIVRLSQWQARAQNDPQYHHAMARFYLQNGETDNALAAYSDSLKLQRDATVLHEALSIHVKADDPQSAVGMYLKYYHPLNQLIESSSH